MRTGLEETTFADVLFAINDDAKHNHPRRRALTDAQLREVAEEDARIEAMFAQFE